MSPASCDDIMAEEHEDACVWGDIEMFTQFRL